MGEKKKSPKITILKMAKGTFEREVSNKTISSVRTGDF